MQFNLIPRPLLLKEKGSKNLILSFLSPFRIRKGFRVRPVNQEPGEVDIRGWNGLQNKFNLPIIKSSLSLQQQIEMKTMQLHHHHHITCSQARG